MTTDYDSINNELAMLAYAGGMPKDIKIDSETLAHDAKVTTGKNRKERREASSRSKNEDNFVEVDSGFEYTPYSYSHADHVEARDALEQLEERIVFPGSLSASPGTMGWWIERSHNDDLPFTGSIGRLRTDYGRIYCCVLSDGEQWLFARVVRDPDFNPSAHGPKLIHRD